MCEKIKETCTRQRESENKRSSLSHERWNDVTLCAARLTRSMHMVRKRKEGGSNRREMEGRKEGRKGKLYSRRRTKAEASENRTDGSERASPAF